ncbi:hypothetical protein MMC06_005674 [Schaereria dolodes]|nr:hypothetical protein [Schaereria dolodes]
MVRRQVQLGVVRNTQPLILSSSSPPKTLIGNDDRHHRHPPATNGPPTVTVITSSNIALAPATEADYPAIVDIHYAAFSPSVIAHLSNKTEVEQKALLMKTLRENLPNPKILLIKATDTSNGEVTGFGIWTLSSGKEKGKEKGKEQGMRMGALLRYSVNEGEKGGRRSLADAFDEAIKEKETYWLKGKKHMFLKALAVAPASQRRGIGTALVQFGMKMADEGAAVCFLHATPIGHGLYRKLGWKDVGSLDFDLTEWGGESRGYGMFQLFSMIRLHSPVE